jgi:hypothetical protein
MQAARPRKLSREIGLAEATSHLLLVVGATALVLSIVFVSSILAFIGLGLVFWGAVLLYASPEEGVKTTILNATTVTLLKSMDKIIRDGNYQGIPIYLPPKYLKDYESSRIYLSKEKSLNLPSPQEVLQKEDENLFSNSSSLLLMPPGADLAALFEHTLGTTFTKVDLQFLENNLPRLFVEELEIAENMEIENEDNRIRMKMGNYIYKDAMNELGKLNIVNQLGCPVGSAIACALAKASGKPVIIEKYHVSDDGRTINIEYYLLEEPAAGAQV